MGVTNVVAGFCFLQCSTSDSSLLIIVVVMLSCFSISVLLSQQMLRSSGICFSFVPEDGGSRCFRYLITHLWNYTTVLPEDVLFNRLTPNDAYMGRTAPLTSKRCILYIYSTHIGTEYFKLYSLFFFSSKCSLFHNANLFGSCIIHILYTGCAKIKKKKKLRRQRVNWTNTRTSSKLAEFLLNVPDPGFAEWWQKTRLV